MATSARTSAQRGMYGVRAWTAPRLEQSGKALQEQVAPRLSSMMATAAHRIDPARPARRRWAMLTTGIIMIAGAGAAAAIMISRRGPGSITRLGRAGEGAAQSSTEGAGAEAGAGGQVRTS